MAKKVIGFIKLHVTGGQANPAPPVGPALGQQGVNIMEFCKQFNSKTQQQNGVTIPVEITVYADRSFYVHHEDAAGVVPDQEGRRSTEGLRGAESRKGWNGDSEVSSRRSPGSRWRISTRTIWMPLSACCLVAHGRASMGIVEVVSEDEKTKKA